MGNADLGLMYGVEKIDVDKIVPSPANKREHRGKEIDALAESIRAQGLLQPPMVRRHPTKPEKYELVCGERRWLAMKTMAKKLPVMVRELTDDQAYEITVVENLQRENLTPLEEAGGVEMLLKAGRTVEEVADRLGKPRGWVARRARLSALSPRWVKAMGEETGIGRWPVTYVELVARFDVPVQDLILKSLSGWGMDGMTMRGLKEVLSSFLANLRSAPWKLEEEGPGERGACASCEKQTGREVNLFDEPVSEKTPSYCLDRVCWGEKMRVFVERKEQELRKENSDLVLVGKGSGMGRESVLPVNHPLKSVALEQYEVRACKRGEKGAMQSLTIDGPGAGKTGWVKVESERGKKKLEGGGAGKTLAERKEGLEKRRMKVVVGEIVTMLEGEVANPNRLKAKPGVDVLAAAACFGLKRREDVVEDEKLGWNCGDEWKMLGRTEKKVAGNMGQAVIEVGRCLMAVWAGILRNELVQMKYAGNKLMLDSGGRMCAWLGVAIEDYVAKGKETCPEPKAWKKEQEATKKVGGEARKKAKVATKGKKG